MSPQAATMLWNAIMPIIRTTVPHTVKPAGCEDHEELIQDTLAMAAGMVDSAERNGQKLIPRSIAFYSIQAAKSGRRSTCGGRSDAMSSAAQLDGNTALQSMDESAYSGDDTKPDVTLGDMLTDKKDDPATIGTRNLDWSEFLKTQDKRSIDVVVGMAQGKMTKDIAREHSVTPARVVQLKRKVGNQIKQAWGDQIVAQATEKPAWRRAMDNRKW